MILEVKGIRKCFGGVVALSDGNLVCRRGKITGLLGANGSGKSTISKIITGVYSADCGEVNYNGQCVKYKNPNEARRDGIAMVFQNLSLVPDLTVWQNIVLGQSRKKGLDSIINVQRNSLRRLLISFIRDLILIKRSIS